MTITKDSREDGIKNFYTQCVAPNMEYREFKERVLKFAQLSNKPPSTIQNNQAILIEVSVLSAQEESSDDNMIVTFRSSTGLEMRNYKGISGG